MLRFFTVFGPWGRPDMALFLFVDAILKGKPIDLFNRGDMIRDFTYVGDIVEGKVVRVTNFGAFVELAEGIEGLIHVSEFDDSHHAGKDDKLELKVGETYQMKIIRLIPGERKIGLSIRALKNDEFRADWEAYTETTGRPEVTLGDHFKHQQ